MFEIVPTHSVLLITTTVSCVAPHDVAANNDVSDSHTVKVAAVLAILERTEDWVTPMPPPDTVVVTEPVAGTLPARALDSQARSKEYVALVEPTSAPAVSANHLDAPVPLDTFDKTEECESQFDFSQAVGATRKADVSRDVLR